MSNSDKDIKVEYGPDNAYGPRGKLPVSYIKNLSKLIDKELERIVPKQSSKGFGSIEFRPKKMNFATQNPDEKIYVLVRTHWSKNIGWFTSNLIYALLPFLILFLADIFNFSLSFISFRVYFVIALSYYSLLFTNVLRHFYDWYFDVFIVTNQRVLDYEFKPFTSYKILEAELESIQDVQEQAAGILADLFGYGDLKIRTASTTGELTFNSIPDPTEVRNILMDLIQVIDQYRNGNRFE